MKAAVVTIAALCVLNVANSIPRDLIWGHPPLSHYHHHPSPHPGYFHPFYPMTHNGGYSWTNTQHFPRSFGPQFRDTLSHKNLTEMEKESIVPEVIDTLPKSVLHVRYGNLLVDLGNIMTPTQVRYPPAIHWNSDPNKLYVLCMTDPDAPSRKDPNLREWHHWLVGNIPGNDIFHGEALSQYIGSGPRKGTGIHRYIFLVYEQPRKLDFDEKRLTNVSTDNRDKFSIRDFAKKYNLGEPIAGNFYQAEWDESVPSLYVQLGMPGVF